MAQMDVERPRRASPARGVALIATAVILGLFVLRNGFELPESADDASSEADPPDPAAGTGPAPGGATTTTATPEVAARPPAEVTVIVANTTDVGGAAATMSETLAGQGYVLAEPTDADPALEVTQVQFLPGSELEAQAVATAAGAPPESVTPASDPLPILEPGSAQVIVLLGADLARAG